METIETSNKFLVGALGDDLVFAMPVPRVISQADAILLAAWLVAMAEDFATPETTFATVLQAVRG